MRKDENRWRLRDNLANVITSARFAFAAGVLLTPPFSVAFWACYICGGLSDVMDGIVARKCNLQSAAGARLDSVADAFFLAAVCAVVIVNAEIPVWLWLCTLAVAMLRLIGYAIGFYRYRTFTSLHTYLNKATGILLFTFPVLYTLLGMEAAGGILCCVASVSSLEELAITVTSKELDRDRKSLLIR